jgi:hypothetical protein
VLLAVVGGDLSLYLRFPQDASARITYKAIFESYRNAIGSSGRDSVVTPL